MGLWSHLGMTGKWQRSPAGAPAPRFSHARLVLDDGSVLHYCDMRRFGRLQLVAGARFADVPRLAALGPDPLRDGVDATELHARFARLRQPVKVALLDQGLLAGVGNIQASEACFRARLDPRRAAASLTRAEVGRLSRAILASITYTLARFAKDGADAGDGAIVYVEEDRASNPFKVYGRAGSYLAPPQRDDRAHRAGGALDVLLPGVPAATTQSLTRMLLDLTPLRRHRDFRLLFLGQFVSFFGSMITYVAVPYQVYQLTHSSLMVGLLGTVQLVPLLFFGLWGGAYADAMDRRRLLIGAEALLTLISGGLAVNALFAHPSVVAIFVCTALMSAVNGFHRPTLEAMSPRLVDRDELPATAALASLRGTLGAVAGPAIGGFCIAHLGTRLDVRDRRRDVPVLARRARGNGGHAARGRGGQGRPAQHPRGSRLRAAAPRAHRHLHRRHRRHDLRHADGAVSPAMAQRWRRGADGRGLALLGHAHRELRHDAAVGLDEARSPPRRRRRDRRRPLGRRHRGAGARAEPGRRHGVPGLRGRRRHGERPVPHDDLERDDPRAPARATRRRRDDRLRRRGPLLGNARAGWMASLRSVGFSIVTGGWICVAGVLLCVPLLPAFWRYRPTEDDAPDAAP